MKWESKPERANKTKGTAKSMDDAIRRYAESIHADVREKKGLWEFSRVVAERKAFLSKKKLTYTAKFRVDDNAKTVVFSEYLAEKGSGLSSGGGGFDDGISPGFGFKASTYKTGPSGIAGTIKEQSDLFGKQYTYDFRYEQVRKQIEALAEQAGYSFDYKVLPIGI